MLLDNPHFPALRSDPMALQEPPAESKFLAAIVTENDKVQNEGVIWRVPPKPYGISYRSIIPKKGECENIFSPICLSATHVAPDQQRSH